jgi:predicted RND superfamily exporter protein
MVLVISIAGFKAYKSIPREAAPDIQIPLLIVSIPFPGATPEDVESLITNKVEQELKTIKNLKEISSTSSEGVAVLTLEFTSDFDISEARTKVREKMDQIKPDLPADAEDYQVTEINLSEQPLMILNLAGDLGLLGLTELADEVKEEIETKNKQDNNLPLYISDSTTTVIDVKNLNASGEVIEGGVGNGDELMTIAFEDVPEMAEENPEVTELGELQTLQSQLEAILDQASPTNRIN